jgi:WD40 repeat protein
MPSLVHIDIHTFNFRYHLFACLFVSSMQACNSGPGNIPVQLQPLLNISQRSQPGFAHKYLVTSLAWYPVDTGLFLTGSADKTVKLWDTST